MKNKIITNKWSLVCQGSSVEAVTNLLSIYKVVDEVTVHPPKGPISELPKDGISVLFPHEFLSFWTRDTEDLAEMKTKAEVNLIAPNKEILFHKDVDLVFQKDKPNLRFIVKSEALKIKIVGEYHYEMKVFIDNKTIVAEASFVVKIGPAK